MSDSTETSKEVAADVRRVGRNEPCPCGSQKKYKRCHGMEVRGAATSVAASTADEPAMPAGMPPGMNPKMMWEMAKVLRKVPKGQLAKLQTLMQQAMAGKDVSKQALELQASLPPDVQQMLIQMGQSMPQQGATNEGAPADEVGEKKGLFSKWRKKEKSNNPD